MSSGTERLIVSQLPQPTRPPNSYETNFQVQADEALEHSYMKSGRHHDEHIIAGESRVRDRLKSKVVEGIFSKVENRGGSQEDDRDIIQSRGIIGEHDSSHKLERFKVRTVVVAEEVVKEGDKK